MIIVTRIFILVTYLIVGNFNVLAQDNNYWNQMPGSRSALLGGAVVGGVRDNSAIFYNPGALGFIDSSSVSIAANSFQYETANILNGGGAAVDLMSKKFQTVPLITISGALKLKPSSKSTFGFMVFTKNQTSSSFSMRVDDSLSWKNVLYGFDTSFYISKNPNIGYIGDFNMSTQLNEIWAGVCYSYRLNKYISFGLSPFIAYRTQAYNKSFVSRVMLDENSNYGQSQVTSLGFSDVSNISSTNIRALGKFGLNFDFGNLKIGLSYTSKSYNLGGTGLISRDISYSGGSANRFFSVGYNYVPGLPFTYVADVDTAAIAYFYNLNDRQAGLKTTFKSPMSISSGIEYQLKNTIFFISVEYFKNTDAYNMITPDSNNFYRSGYISPILYSNVTIKSAKSNKYLKVMEASKEVFNFGFAIEQKLNRNLINAINSLNPKLINLEGLLISASYRSDKSSYKKAHDDFWTYKYGFNKNRDTSITVGQRLTISNVNLNHYTVGLTIQRKKSDLHIGFCYTYGINKNYQTLNNMANPKDNVISNNLGAVPDFNQTANYTYRSYSVLLGYTYHIK